MGQARFSSLSGGHGGGGAVKGDSKGEPSCEEAFLNNYTVGFNDNLDVRKSAIDPEWRNVSLCEVNRERAKVGSAPLAWDDNLARTATKWATVLQMDGCHMEHSTHEWTMR